MSGPKQIAFVIEFPGRVSSQQEIPQMKPMQYYPLQSSNIAPEKVACKILLGIWWLHFRVWVHISFFCADKSPSVFLKRKISTIPNPLQIGPKENTFNVQSDLHQCWDRFFNWYLGLESSVTCFDISYLHLAMADTKLAPFLEKRCQF